MCRVYSLSARLELARDSSTRLEIGSSRYDRQKRKLISALSLSLWNRGIEISGGNALEFSVINLHKSSEAIEIEMPKTKSEHLSFVLINLFSLPKPSIFIGPFISMTPTQPLENSSDCKYCVQHWPPCNFVGSSQLFYG